LAWCYSVLGRGADRGRFAGRLGPADLGAHAGAPGPAHLPALLREAEIYGDDSLPALQQSLDELQNDMARMLFIKAVVNGKIIGAVRGYMEGHTAHLTRVVVHPYFRRRGIGRRLLDEIEQAFPEATRFEAKTGHQSKRNLYQLNKRGYKEFKTEPFTPAITWVCLEKEREAVEMTNDEGQMTKE
jgi:N-acetylglutamate synthase-like GNAT family acetyltransferase